MTSLSGSSVSAQKSPGTNSENRSRSCDTVCTSNSSCFFKRRKPINPLACSMRPTHHKPNTNTVKQRVLSAKLLKLRQLQSQLNDANFHLAEVARENQVLKTLQKRQDKALSKYENTNADLPRLLNAHEQEIRVLTEKNRNLRRNVKELTEQLKLKDDELNKMKEHLFHLDKLNRDKHLVDREKLMEQVDDLKSRLSRSEEQVTMLNRKLMLENKTSKQRLNAEIAKTKQGQKELLHALNEIDRLSGLLEAKENVVRPRNSKFIKSHLVDSTSLMAMKICQPHKTSNQNGQTPVTEVRLEPLSSAFARKDSGSTASRKNSGCFKAPMESIKQRLTGDSQKNVQLNGTEITDVTPNVKNRPSSSIKLEKLPVVAENQKIANGKAEIPQPVEDQPLDSADKIEKDGFSEIFIREEKRVSEFQSEGEVRPKQVSFENDAKDSESDSSSELTSFLEEINSQKKEKLAALKTLKRKTSDSSGTSAGSIPENDDFERLTDTLDAAIQRATENSKEEFDKKLGSYCSEVLTNMKNCNKVIEVHKENLVSSQKSTDKLMETLKKTEKAEHKLKNSFFNMEDDIDFVHEILNEEFKFQAIHNKSIDGTNSKTHEKKPLVNVESKKKLLATLRAIDNDDSIESLEESGQPGIMKEIFGHLAH
ncbi:uncharacterized protein LOC143202970 [Rhynchophorus ferrugineus]|uniref:uncharacterized protein LOC143202970 n=1 Tax=Rhynchophorus ferrugineus TaxID=354439 RepID=UPI003FCE16BF